MLSSHGRLLVFGLLTVVRTENGAAISICGYGASTLDVSTSSNQSVTSPSYPFNYGYDFDCSLTLEATNIFHVVKVVFKNFTLEPGSITSCPVGPVDRLEFYDGVSELFAEMGTFCGTGRPDVLYSSGRYLHVRFLADFNIGLRPFIGFRFHVSAVPEQEASGICRPESIQFSSIRVARSSGTIFTPNYPVTFEDGVHCDWIITVPEGKRVELMFDVFSLSLSSFCNGSGAQLVIIDGESLSDTVIGTFCGTTLPPVVKSSPFVNSLRIRFAANYQDKKYPGFKARFKAIDDVSPSFIECLPRNPNNDALKLNGSSGTLKSPLYPLKYPPRMSCTWVITVPDGKVIRLKFTSFDVEYDRHCFDDYVEVRDGKYDTSELLGTYCGTTKPDDIVSSDRYLRVHFSSDSDHDSHDGGFLATFQAVEEKNTGTIIGIAVGIVVFACLIICSVCFVKRSMDRRRRARRPVTYTTTGTTASAPVTIPVTSSQHPPSTQVLPQPHTRVSLPSPEPPPPYQEDPPPYPGFEGAPQYPPMGEQYPWYQDSQGGPQPSASPASL